MANAILIDAAIIIIVIVMIVFTIIGLFAFWRFRRSYVLSIEKDYRNPLSGRKKFYAIYNYKKKYYELYNNLLAIRAERAIANVDLKAYVDNFGKVRCIRSPTGKPGDDMIVPIGLSINSQAAAAEMADSLSNGVIDILSKVGIAYDKIRSVNGIGALSDEEVKKIFSDVTIKNLKESFSPEWVMKKTGVRKVEDASIITVPQKNAIASLNTRANEFIVDHSGWWETHGGLVIGLMTIMFVVIGMSILMYGAQSYLHDLGASIPGIVQASYNASIRTNLNLYGINLTKAVP